MGLVFWPLCTLVSRKAMVHSDHQRFAPTKAHALSSLFTSRKYVRRHVRLACYICSEPFKKMIIHNVTIQGGPKK